MTRYHEVISDMGVTPDGTAFKPCPFCGHYPYIEESDRDQYRFEAACREHPSVCGMNVFAFGNTIEELAAKWNRRA